MFPPAGPSTRSQLAPGIYVSSKSLSLIPNSAVVLLGDVALEGRIMNGIGIRMCGTPLLCEVQ